MRAALLVIAALGAALMPPAARAEEPGYTVVAALDAGVEVRDYAPMLVAEVDVGGGDFERAGGAGFEPLADYIFGNNARGERIGMTAPVLQARTPQGWVVGFVMPARYTAATLPAPRDRRIRIVEQPSRQVAAIRFSGRWSTIRYAENLRVLERELAQAGWVATGEPQAAQYNAPWVPGPMRRNEVLLPVRRRE